MVDILPQIRRGGARGSPLDMGLVVWFGSKNLEKYAPTAPTVGLGPSNKLSYGLGVIWNTPSHSWSSRTSPERRLSP